MTAYGVILALGLIAGGVIFNRKTPEPLRDLPVGDAVNEMARVGEVSITADDLARAWARRRPANSSEATRTEILDTLIRRELLLAEAARTGFGNTPEMQKAWRDFIANRMEEHLLSEQPVDREPTETELAEFHAAHADRYSTPEQVRASLIQLSLPRPDALDRNASLARAEDVRRIAAEAGSPEVFARLARDKSRHAASRRRDGDLGWLSRSQAAQFLPPEVGTFLFEDSQLPAISPVLLCTEGIFIVQARNRRTAQVQPLAEVRERVRFDFSRARTAATESSLFESLRERHPVIVHASRLAAWEPLTPVASVSRPPRTPAR